MYWLKFGSKTVNKRSKNLEKNTTASDQWQMEAKETAFDIRVCFLVDGN
jgi:hypothetical protein